MKNSWTIENALRELELEDSATFDDVKKARYDLIQFWHPDAFHNDPKRYNKALLKSQNINSAFDFLSEISTSPSYSFFAHEKSSDSESNENSNHNNYSGKNYNNEYVTPESTSKKSSLVTKFTSLSSSKKAGVILVISIVLITFSIGTEEFFRQGYDKSVGTITQIGTKWSNTVTISGSNAKIPGCEYSYTYSVDNIEYIQKTATKGSSLCPRMGEKKTIWYSKKDHHESYTSIAQASRNILSLLIGLPGSIGALISFCWLFIIFIRNLRSKST